MRADRGVYLPPKIVWRACSWIRWVVLSSGRPRGRAGTTARRALGNECCADKGGQGCLLILIVSGERACCLLQGILRKIPVPALLGTLTDPRDGLCLVRPQEPGRGCSQHGAPHPGGPALIWMKASGVRGLFLTIGLLRKQTDSIFLNLI